jgi:hypothetical protein
MNELFSVQCPRWYRGFQTTGLLLPHNVFVAKFVLAYSAQVDKAANILNGAEDGL